MRVLVAMVWMIAFALPAAATEVSAGELDAAPDGWNGLEVTVVGEVVGDYSVRKEWVWVQLNDDPYVSEPLSESGRLQGANVSVGVRLPSDLFSETWGPPGSYRVRGPVLAVTGVFRYADPATGGETFVDATEVELLEPALALEAPPSEMGLLFAAVAMMAFGGGLWGRARWRLLNPKE